jgi:putative ABC transport system substrate-binding protein
MRRREFITLLGGAAAWPIVARGQQSPLPVIGLLNTVSPDLNMDRLRAFHEGLRQSGYVEGQNVRIEYRWANNRYERLPDLAAELVDRQVDVIVAVSGAPAPLAAKAATKTIPIVFVIGSDPVELGLVAALNRPGGNLTGISSSSAELGPKRLELLHEAAPGRQRIAALVNPTSLGNAATRPQVFNKAASALGIELYVLNASTDAELASAFATLRSMRIEGLIIGSDTFFTSRSELLAVLTVSHSIPAIFQYREFVAAGGLMSYGSSFTDPSRQAGIYTARILKGERPADLPVQLATKAELILNLKTAKALGVTVPLALLGRANEVIE